MTSTDDILTIIRAGRGQRPASLDNVETEQVLTITLALLVELGVAIDRIDRLERTLAKVAGQPLDSIREAPLGPEAEAERQDAQAALVAWALRIFFDDRVTIDRETARHNRKGAQ